MLALQLLCNGIVILFDGHNIRRLSVADRVIIMNSGQIVFDGGRDELRASNVWNYF